MRKCLLIIATVVAIPVLAGGCFFDIGGGGEESAKSDDHKGNQVVTIDAPSLRAKFSVIDDRSKKIIVKGVTPNTVLLNTDGDYHVEITHPKTGEVHKTEIKSRKNAEDKHLLVPETITAEFDN